MAKYTDEQIEMKLREALEEYGCLNSLEVSVCLENGHVAIEYWREDEYGDECDYLKELDNDQIETLEKVIDTPEELETFLDGIIFSEGDPDEFYQKAQEAIEEEFGCTGAYLEPSTQCGRGGVFLFADDMSFEGTFDFETGEEYIRENDLAGFINLALSSFTPCEDEDEEDEDEGTEEVDE